MVRWQRRWLIAIAFAATGLVALAACSDDSATDDGDPVATAATGTTITTGTTSTAVAAPSSTTAEPEPNETEDQADDRSDDETDPVTAVVMAGGLTDEFIDVIGEVPGVEALAVIQSGQLRLVASEDSAGTPVDELAEGFVIQIDARAYESLATAARFVPELSEALGDLGPNDVLLSESSAAIRRLDVGSTITFAGPGDETVEGGSRFEVAAILPDDIVGSTEVLLVGPDAMSSAGAASPRRVAFVDYSGTGEQLEQTLLAANDGEGIRVFGGRSGTDDEEEDERENRDRAVLAQLRVKEIFGEFAHRPRSGGAIEIDQDWVDQNIVSVDLPLLGTTKCHRIYADILTEVLQGLIDDGLEDVIDPAAFQGCWNPRFIGGSDRLSRHAWGIAADINFFNPLDGGPGSPVNPELLDRMRAAGITSGHEWSTPDPGHFEYLDGEVGD